MGSLYIFSEKTFLCHWPFVWEQRLDTIFYQLMGDCWCTVTGVCYDHSR